MKKSKTRPADKAPVTESRHEQRCAVCKHAQRAEIELQYINWKSPDDIATEHGISRDSMFRHVRAIPKLKQQRSRNLRAALEVVIEKGQKVEVTAAAMVQAVQAYAKINDRGQWVDKHEHSGAIFTQEMTQGELEHYAKTGELPARIAEKMSATSEETEEPEDNG